LNLAKIILLNAAFHQKYGLRSMYIGNILSAQFKKVTGLTPSHFK